MTTRVTVDTYAGHSVIVRVENKSGQSWVPAPEQEVPARTMSEFYLTSTSRISFEEGPYAQSDEEIAKAKEVAENEKAAVASAAAEDKRILTAGGGKKKSAEDVG